MWFWEHTQLIIFPRGQQLSLTKIHACNYCCNYYFNTDQQLIKILPCRCYLAAVRMQGRGQYPTLLCRDPGGGPSAMARLPASPVPKPTVILMPVLSLEMGSHDLHFTSWFGLDVSQWLHSHNGQRVCHLFAEVLWRIPHQNCFGKTFCAVQACDLIHRLPSLTPWV